MRTRALLLNNRDRLLRMSHNSDDAYFAFFPARSPIPLFLYMKTLWQKKSIPALETETLEMPEALSGADSAHWMRRTLSGLDVVLLGIGCVFGAGSFVLSGPAAAAFAGPSIMLFFALGALVYSLAGLCYAEMASIVPVSGSAYTYAYATLGELVAWMIGWDLILEYCLGATTVAIGWSGYAGSILRNFGIVLPERWSE